MGHIQGGMPLGNKAKKNRKDVFYLLFQILLQENRTSVSESQSLSFNHRMENIWQKPSETRKGIHWNTMKRAMKMIYRSLNVRFDLCSFRVDSPCLMALKVGLLSALSGPQLWANEKIHQHKLTEFCGAHQEKFYLVGRILVQKGNWLTCETDISDQTSISPLESCSLH